MKKEEMDKKFEKLSDINKIRYNLGRISFINCEILFFVGIFGMVTIGFLFMLPLVILYGELNRLVLMSVVGSLLTVVGAIFLGICSFRLIKMNEKIEDFLNKNSKK